MDPVELAALRLAVGEQPSEELPAIATEALVRGLDSPTLRQAAGVSPREVHDAEDLFRATVAELGFDLPDEQGALWRLVRYTAEQIVSGQQGAYDGAVWIWRHAYHRVDGEGDLRVCVGLASEWEDHPSERPKLEAAIVEQAQVLLDRAAPRRWLKVMAKAGCSPIWQPNPALNLDLADLSIAPDLSDDLARWAADFDATFSDDPGASGVETQREAEEFVDIGRHLVERLQASLGSAWHVEYMPEATRPPGLRLRSSPRAGRWRRRRSEPDGAS